MRVGGVSLSVRSIRVARQRLHLRLGLGLGLGLGFLFSCVVIIERAEVLVLVGGSFGVLGGSVGSVGGV